MIRPNLNSFTNEITYVDVEKRTKFLNTNIKWSMLFLAIELGAANMKKTECDALFHAIIKTGSYYNSLKAPGISVARFTRYWYKYKRNAFSRPQDIQNTFMKKEKKKRKSYVDVILRLYPKLLHKLFRYLWCQLLEHQAGQHQLSIL